MPAYMKHVGALAVVLAAIGSVSCGYALAGRGNVLPPEIQLIGVPQFVNESTTPEIDRILTDMVRAEFQSKGRYRVQPDDVAVDGLFTCTVRNVELRPTGFTAERLPTSYAIIVVANVEFKNQRDNGAVLWANPSFRIMDEYQVTSEGTLADVNAFFTQNANAQERLARKFARDVVTAIFEAF